MKLIIEKISPPGAEGPFPGVRKGSHLIAHQNWVSAPDVKVSFSVKHDGSSIHLFYFVEEPYLRAIHRKYNSAVWEDSCVEFFLSFEGDGNYYNFECNCIGTLLAGYGPDRQNRELLPEELLKKVATDSSLGSNPIGEMEGPAPWDIYIRIPCATFCFNPGAAANLTGLKATGNFYKCGDLLPAPHYLSWNRVGTPEPDFHQPGFFGEFLFQE